MSVTAILLVGLTAGCGGDDSNDLPPPQSPAPTTPTPRPTLDPVEAEVLAALKSFMDALTTATNEPDPSGSDLEDLVVAPMLDVLTDQIRLDQRENRRYAGDIEVVRAEITEEDLDSPQPWLRVEACLDGGGYSLVDIDTGELVGVDTRERPARHVTHIDFQVTDDGRWLFRGASMPNWFYGEPEENFEPC